MTTSRKEGDSPLMIREVWAENLEEELKVIRTVVDRYPYVAMDTEFPGVVVRPTGVFRSSSEYNYQTLRLNVNKLKMIQLGLSFTDEHGNLARSTTGESCIWQFNFKEFNPREDPHAPESIDLLRRSGIDLELNEEKGIDSSIFAELLMSSGIVLNEDVQWVTFHSAYDFGYLLKILTHQDLPCEQANFLSLIKVFFPTIYDVKYLMRFCDNLLGGLNRLAEKLKVERFGSCHQAGSDSLLTSHTYMKLKKEFFHGSTEQYAGVLYGLDCFGSKCNSSNFQSRSFCFQNETPKDVRHFASSWF